MENVIKHNLKETDFSGTLRDLMGDPVPNVKYGGYYNHEQEMRQSYSALKKVISRLTGSLKNPYLSELDREILQEALDTALEYLKRIEDLFEGFGGIH